MLKHIFILIQSVTLLFSLSSSDIKIHKQKCEATKDYASCLLLNQHYMTVYNQESIEYFTPTCDKGLISSCRSLAELYKKGGNTIAKDLPKAVKYYTKVCDSGNAITCATVAYLYLIGNDIKQDKEKACEYFTQSCLNGYAGGCSSLGMMYAKGDGIKKDIKYAVDLFKDACDDGDKLACIQYKRYKK